MDIYIQRDGQIQGPFSQGVYQKKFELGELQPDDLVSMDQTTWYPVSRLADPAPVVLPVRPKQTIQVATATQAGKRTCSRCGAPYSIWSPFRAMGSGLCTKCTKETAKPSRPPIHERPIESREDALKVVNVTTVIYIVLAFINFAISNVLMGTMIIGCSVALWLFRSRVASIALMVISVLGIVGSIAEMSTNSSFTKNYSITRIWMMLCVFQVVLTAKAIHATFKLQKQFADKRAANDGSKMESRASSKLVPEIYLCIIVVILLVTGMTLLSRTGQENIVGRQSTNLSNPQTALPTPILRKSPQPVLLDEQEGKFSVEKHRHIFDPTPRPDRLSPLSSIQRNSTLQRSGDVLIQNNPTPTVKSTPTDTAEISLGASEETFRRYYGEPVAILHDGPVEKNTFTYERGDVIVIVCFWEGAAQNITVARLDRKPIDEPETLAALNTFAQHMNWNRVKNENDNEPVVWLSDNAVAYVTHYQYKDDDGKNAQTTCFRILTKKIFAEYDRLNSSK